MMRWISDGSFGGVGGGMRGGEGSYKTRDALGEGGYPFARWGRGCTERGRER